MAPIVERVCLFCEQPLHGRRDKKYCDSNCRALSHREKQRAEEADYLNVLTILKNNRRILRELNPSGHTVIRKSFLVRQGYDFNYFTNIYQPKSGGTYYFCFEFGFKELDHAPHKVDIVNLQSYMAKYRHPLWKHSNV